MKKCELGIACGGKNNGFIVANFIDGKKFVCGDCLIKLRENGGSININDSGSFNESVSEVSLNDKKKEWRETVKDLLNDYCYHK